jgi:hydroxyethylthiazole kinase-like uncharacterized protein yjeF
LTPHDGEFQRLAGGDEKFKEDRPAAARALAAAHGVTMLLKGPSSLVAASQGGLAVNSTGNASLATAGSGDVLAGLCGALLAQGMGDFEAGRLGAYLHGLASDIRQEKRGNTGLTASELTTYLAEAFSRTGGRA